MIAACQAEKRALISLDLDFSNILQYPPPQYAGLIVLRLHRPGPRALAALIRRLLPHLEQVAVAGRLWIVDERRIRIHRVGEIDLGPDTREVALP